EHGTLERLVENAATVPGKIGEKLRENLDALWLSFRLATIKRDVILELEINDLVHQDEDVHQLHTLFTQLEFKSWIKEMESKGAQPADAVASVSTAQSMAAPMPGGGVAEGSDAL